MKALSLTTAMATAMSSLVCAEDLEHRQADRPNNHPPIVKAHKKPAPKERIFGARIRGTKKSPCPVFKELTQKHKDGLITYSGGVLESYPPQYPVSGPAPVIEELCNRLGGKITARFIGVDDVIQVDVVATLAKPCPVKEKLKVYEDTHMLDQIGFFSGRGNSGDTYTVRGERKFLEELTKEIAALGGKVKMPK